MGKRKKFTPDELVQKWTEYKAYCNDYPVLVHDFSAKNSEFVSAENGDESDFSWFRDPERRTFNGYLSVLVRRRPNCKEPIVRPGSCRHSCQGSGCPSMDIPPRPLQRSLPGTRR